MKKKRILTVSFIRGKLLFVCFMIMFYCILKLIIVSEPSVEMKK